MLDQELVNGILESFTSDLLRSQKPDLVSMAWERLSKSESFVVLSLDRQGEIAMMVSHEVEDLLSADWKKVEVN